MQATITADAIAHQAMTGLLYEPHRHEVLPRLRWLESFKRYAKRKGFKFADDLFVYFNKTAGSYVIAVWLEPPGWRGRPGTMRELEVIKGHPGRLDWEYEVPDTDPPQRMRSGPRLPRFDWLLEKLLPYAMALKQMRREALARAKEFLRERELEQDERAEFAKFAEHKFGHHDETPRLIRSGILPFAVGDPKDDFARQMSEILRDPDRVRDIKHRSGRA